MATITEQFSSRPVTTGKAPTATQRFDITDVATQPEALNALVGELGAYYDIYGTGSFLLPLKTVSVDRIGPDHWLGIARYRTDIDDSSIVNEQEPGVEEPEFVYNIGLGSEHITHSLETVGSYSPAGETSPDFHNAINVTSDGVEGTMVPVVVQRFEQHYHIDDAIATPAFWANLGKLAGRMNDAAFAGFEAGEVLFEGLEARKRGSSRWRTTFRFAVRPNATDFAVGDITGISKKGFEYLWIYFVEEEDTAAHTLVNRPRCVKIERICEYADFSILEI